MLIQSNLNWTKSFYFCYRQTVNAYISCPRAPNLNATPRARIKAGINGVGGVKKNKIAVWHYLSLSYAYCFIFRLNPLPSVRMPRPAHRIEYLTAAHAPTHAATFAVHFLYANPQSSGGFSAAATTVAAAFYFHCLPLCFSFSRSSNSVTA